MGETVRRFLLYVARRWMCLTCSNIVLHMSSELYVVPTNIYSCHSSTVCIDATCMVSWNHSVEYEHEHSAQFVCVLRGGGGGEWSFSQTECDLDNVTSHFYLFLL